MPVVLLLLLVVAVPAHVPPTPPEAPTLWVAVRGVWRAVPHVGCRAVLCCAASRGAHRGGTVLGGTDGRGTPLGVLPGGGDWRHAVVLLLLLLRVGQ
jgi:hypothetical protein